MSRAGPAAGLAAGLAPDLPPDLPPRDFSPAELDALWHGGRVGYRALVATLIDLVRRDVLSVNERRGVDAPGSFGTRDLHYRLHRDTHRKAGLDEPTRFLLAFLFDMVVQDDALPIDTLLTYGDVHRLRAGQVYRDWRVAAQRLADRRGFIEAGGRRALLAASALGGATMLTGSVLGIARSRWDFVALPAGLALMLASRLLVRRTPEAQALYVRLRSFRDALSTLQQGDEAATVGAKTWGRYLVAAVVFGIEDDVVAALREADRDVLGDARFAATWGWALTRGAGLPQLSAEVFVSVTLATAGGRAVAPRLGGARV